ncbi:uncharacterized protein O3C94_015637 [Discoglossus pictus]
MPKCIVDGCPNEQRRTTHSSLHVFPSSPEKIKLWLLSTGQDFGDIDKFVQCIRDAKKDNRYRMCSLHFTPQSYYTQGVRKCLKLDAIPTIFAKQNIYGQTVKAINEHPTISGPINSSINVLQSDTKQDPNAVQEHNYASDRVTYRCTTSGGTNVGTDDVNMDTKLAERILNNTLQIIYLLTGKVPLSQNLTSSLMKDKDLKEMNKRIINHVLEIISLLSGGEYIFVENNSPNICTNQPTGEVSVNCDDVTVRSSTKELKYVEEHKELYKDVLVENRQALKTSENKISGLHGGHLQPTSIKLEVKEESDGNYIQQVDIHPDLGAAFAVGAAC